MPAIQWQKCHIELLSPVHTHSYHSKGLKHRLQHDLVDVRVQVAHIQLPRPIRLLQILSIGSSPGGDTEGEVHDMESATMFVCLYSVGCCHVGCVLRTCSSLPLWAAALWALQTASAHSYPLPAQHHKWNRMQSGNDTHTCTTQVNTHTCTTQVNTHTHMYNTHAQHK